MRIRFHCLFIHGEPLTPVRGYAEKTRGHQGFAGLHPIHLLMKSTQDQSISTRLLCRRAISPTDILIRLLAGRGWLPMKAIKGL